jgi:hypothetical protein
MIKFYKPNSKNLGLAVQFKIGLDKKEGYSIYFSGIKQASWNDQTKKGSFSQNAKDESKIFNIKFNEFEIASLIQLFESGDKWSVFHGFDNNKTSINFTITPTKQGDRNVCGFVIIRNSADEFKGFFEISETILIKKYFEWYLNKLFDYRMENDTKFNKNNSQKPANAQEYMQKFEQENGFSAENNMPF